MFQIITVAAFFVALAAPVNAQTFPDRPVHILVPYAPGGITDIAARLVGAKLGEYWGHQVVVENRPGGNGLIAMTAAVRADPDGYTLVMASAYCLIWERYPDGANAAGDPMLTDRPRQVAFPACSTRGAAGGSGLDGM